MVLTPSPMTGSSSSSHSPEPLCWTPNLKQRPHPLDVTSPRKGHEVTKDALRQKSREARLDIERLEYGVIRWEQRLTPPSRPKPSHLSSSSSSSAASPPTPPTRTAMQQMRRELTFSSVDSSFDRHLSQAITLTSTASPMEGVTHQAITLTSAATPMEGVQAITLTSAATPMEGVTHQASQTTPSRMCPINLIIQELGLQEEGTAAEAIQTLDAVADAADAATVDVPMTSPLKGLDAFYQRVFVMPWQPVMRDDAVRETMTEG